MRRKRAPHHKIIKNIGINKASKNKQNKNKSKTVKVKINNNSIKSRLKNITRTNGKSQTDKIQNGKINVVNKTKNNDNVSNLNKQWILNPSSTVSINTASPPNHEQFNHKFIDKIQIYRTINNVKFLYNRTKRFGPNTKANKNKNKVKFK
jgi:hypothetical protein